MLYIGEGQVSEQIKFERFRNLGFLARRLHEYFPYYFREIFNSVQ
jgi:hypothetical protein